MLQSSGSSPSSPFSLPACISLVLFVPGKFENVIPALPRVGVDPGNRPSLTEELMAAENDVNDGCVHFSPLCRAVMLGVSSGADGLFEMDTISSIRKTSL